MSGHSWLGTCWCIKATLCHPRQRVRGHVCISLCHFNILWSSAHLWPLGLVHLATFTSMLFVTVMVSYTVSRVIRILEWMPTYFYQNTDFSFQSPCSESWSFSGIDAVTIKWDYFVMFAIMVGIRIPLLHMSKLRLREIDWHLSQILWAYSHCTFTALWDLVPRISMAHVSIRTENLLNSVHLSEFSIMRPYAKGFLVLWWSSYQRYMGDSAYLSCRMLGYRVIKGIK